VLDVDRRCREDLGEVLGHVRVVDGTVERRNPCTAPPSSELLVLSRGAVVDTRDSRVIEYSDEREERER
jgi:hypothetical protein